MSDHEPVVTSTVTITETPQGISRTISVTVSNGDAWEAATMQNAALEASRAGTEAAYLNALAADLRRRNDRAERSRLHVVQVNPAADLACRNPDPQEGA